MTLLPQQEEAVSKLERLKVGALFMEPGTGKTLTAHHLVSSVKSIDTVLWLTPFQTKKQLALELERYGILPNLNIVGIESLSSSDRLYLECLNLVKTHKVFIVLDESLKIKNAEAIRSKRLLELSKYCQYRLVLNGTPITRNILDLWAQFEFLSPMILRMSLAEYKNTFCEWVKVTTRHNGVVKHKEYISKYHNVDYLYSIISPYVYECELSIPIGKEREDVPYKIEGEEREEYQRLKEKYLDNDTLMRMNNNIFLEMTTKMQHGYCCAPSKFKALEGLLDGEDTAKVMVYTKYVRSREALQDMFPNLQVLTYGKHSLGLNLQKYNTTIYFDKTFDYAQMAQSEFRTFRTGQTEDCRYITMTGDVGLEKLIEDNIQKKQALSEYFKTVGNNEKLKQAL